LSYLIKGVLIETITSDISVQWQHMLTIFLEICMLYHVSRRTDVPGCYWEWFLRRIDAGHVLVRNPHYPEKVSRCLHDNFLKSCYDVCCGVYAGSRVFVSA
jgi:hypothetical protein